MREWGSQRALAKQVSLFSIHVLVEPSDFQSDLLQREESSYDLILPK